MGVCALTATFVCARGHRQREERIWQACLLSPQNNCLWITWGESHWRHLEMTLPGDSLNHVHIRSEAWFDFVCGDLVCESLCVCRSEGRGCLSFSRRTVKYFHYVRAQTSKLWIHNHWTLPPSQIYHLWLSSIPHGKSWRANDRNILVQILMTSGTSCLFTLVKLKRLFQLLLFLDSLLQIKQMSGENLKFINERFSARYAVIIFILKGKCI